MVWWSGREVEPPALAGHEILGQPGLARARFPDQVDDLPGLPGRLHHRPLPLPAHQHRGPREGQGDRGFSCGSGPRHPPTLLDLAGQRPGLRQRFGAELLGQQLAAALVGRQGGAAVPGQIMKAHHPAVSLLREGVQVQGPPSQGQGLGGPPLRLQAVGLGLGSLPAQGVEVLPGPLKPLLEVGKLVELEPLQQPPLEQRCPAIFPRKGQGEELGGVHLEALAQGDVVVAHHQFGPGSVAQAFEGLAQVVAGGGGRRVGPEPPRQAVFGGSPLQGQIGQDRRHPFLQPHLPPRAHQSDGSQKAQSVRTIRRGGR